jgi:hypothetical protein
VTVIARSDAPSGPNEKIRDGSGPALSVPTKTEPSGASARARGYPGAATRANVVTVPGACGAVDAATGEAAGGGGAGSAGGGGDGAPAPDCGAGTRGGTPAATGEGGEGAADTDGGCAAAGLEAAGALAGAGGASAANAGAAAEGALREVRRTAGIAVVTRVTARAMPTTIVYT